MNIDGRKVAPVRGSTNFRPTLVWSAWTFGRSGNPSSRRVDRVRRSVGPSPSPGSSSSGSPSGSGSSGGSGSSTRCHPSRHCCIRSRRALSAHDGQTLARVEPQGMGTEVTSPVARSLTFRSNGRRHTPTLSAPA
ncbi:hypothetical protein D4739_15355 [Nocardioides cavernaquae]|uniref:Uncharacterized protein n=1 Tax=Nocardioides cavernaquae TaxID=2321396 RepID=A0A3A5HIC3_9ACTN|nr:hypothetical protein D4739_15355 [Nocardioides cavernaquae]